MSNIKLNNLYLLLFILTFSLTPKKVTPSKNFKAVKTNEQEICDIEKQIETKKRELKTLEQKLESLKTKSKPKEVTISKGDKVFYDLGSGTGKVAVHAYLFDPKNPKIALDFIEKNYKDIRGEIPETERQMITKGKGSPVYGEILPGAFDTLLKLPELKITGFKKVVGIELSPTRNFHAKTIANKIKDSELNVTGKSLEFLNENITDADFSDADVIYMCSTCYPTDLMEDILKSCAKLKNGLIVMSLKAFPENFANFGFKLIKEITLPMTWSENKGGSPVYIYKLNK